MELFIHHKKVQSVLYLTFGINRSQVIHILVDEHTKTTGESKKKTKQN